MRNKIVVFGDSITFGAWDKECGGWVNRLRLSVDNDTRIEKSHVFNMGISGQVTEEILDRIDDECRRRIRDDAKNTVILAAGINDTQVIRGEIRVPEGEFRYNVRSLIRRAQRYADNVLYVGLTRVDESRTSPWAGDRTKTWKNALIERYDRIIEEICDEEGADYIRMLEVTDPMSNYDGLHPDAEGHRRIAEAVRTRIDGYLGL
ncbi:MAG: hypothetical protein KBS63_03415 [Clostridiales bacterium]|nr:hypothetical protein [Candidatus Crickella caballi]